MRVCAFLREGGCASQFWIKPGIDFGEGMNDRLFPVVADYFDRSHLSGRILVDELFGLCLETLAVERGNRQGEKSCAEYAEDGEASHVDVLLQGTCQFARGNSFFRFTS